MAPEEPAEDVDGPGDGVDGSAADRRPDDEAGPALDGDDAGGIAEDVERDPTAAAGEDEGADSPVSDSARTFVKLLVAVGLTVGGVVASLLGAIPVVLFGGDTVVGFGGGLVLGEVGFALVALGFLLATGRGVAYLDLTLPGTTVERGVVVVFTVVAFAVRTIALLVAQRLGVRPAQSSIANTGLPFEVLVVILLPAMLLVVGPAEELLFRGVIQKYLRERLSAPAAIVAAGLLFGAIHVFSLVQASGLGTVVSLVVITGVGFGLGWLYEYTGSLPAAMVAHGGYNALIVVSAYALHVAG